MPSINLSLPGAISTNSNKHSPIGSLLAGFEPVTLEAISQIPITGRRDTKFVLPAEQLIPVLQAFKPHYKALFISDRCILNYYTHYFDTPGFEMYTAHHNGKLKRFKVRKRTYQATQDTFLEVKIKKNNGRHLKLRLPSTPFSGLDQADFIRAHTGYEPLHLASTVEMTYDRITLMASKGTERVTIDLNLVFFNKTDRFPMEKLMIIEVKQLSPGKTEALNVLESLDARPCSVSKYCLGVNHLYPHLKKNKFKQLLIQLNNLNHEPSFDPAAA